MPIPTRPSILISLLAVLVGLPAAAQQTSPADDFMIRDVRVFDGETVLEEATVVVRDGVIVAAATGPDPSEGLPEDLPVVDGSGRTLLPGLIDAHVHAFSPVALEQAAVFGVTTVLDMFTAAPFMQIIRARQDAGELQGMADLRSAGTLVTAAGGHGTQFGLPIPTLDDPAEAAEFVAQRIEEGSDYIKIIHEDGSAYGMERPTLAAETVGAVIRAAHQHAVLAVVHVSTLEGARMVAERGADGLVHIFGDLPADEALVSEMEERGMFVTPTLSILASVSGEGHGGELAADPHIAPFLPRVERENLSRTFPPAADRTHIFPNALESVQRLHRRGVPILAGTDAPNPGTVFGASLHGELALLVEAGLSPTEALAAATSAPADAFRMADRGRIAPGLRADLVLVEGDPTTEIAASRRIVAVWKAGYPIERTTQQTPAP